MDKKGFTLIELLGVIILLGIITAITIPAITNQVKKGNEESYNAQIKSIKTAADMYVRDNLNNFSDPCQIIHLVDLQNANYVEKDIKNPLTGEVFDQNMIIKVDKEGKTYTITVNADSACSP